MNASGARRTVAPPRDAGTILERDGELQALTGILDDLDASGGRLALVRGEAGIGKTALIDRFVTEARDRADVVVGAWDDLLTPQPLGPFWDVGREEASVAAALRRGDPRRLNSLRTIPVVTVRGLE